MISIDLKSYFQTIGYNWRQDREQLSHICKLTKTRVDPSRQEISRKKCRRYFNEAQ